MKMSLRIRPQCDEIAKYIDRQKGKRNRSHFLFIFASSFVIFTIFHDVLFWRAGGIFTRINIPTLDVTHFLQKLRKQEYVRTCRPPSIIRKVY